MQRGKRVERRTRVGDEAFGCKEDEASDARAVKGGDVGGYASAVLVEGPRDEDVTEEQPRPSNDGHKRRRRLRHKANARRRVKAAKAHADEPVNARTVRREQQPVALLLHLCQNGVIIEGDPQATP